MRNPHWFRLIPLLLITGCVSPEKPPPASDARDHRELTVFFGSLIDGKDYRSNLTGKMLDGTPRWPASKDAPPLAPRPAVRAALAELSRVVGDPKLRKGRSAKREQNEVSFHSLRHTATSLLKAAGVGEAIAMEFVGHDSKTVSRQYTHIETKALKEAAAKLPDITK